MTIYRIVSINGATRDKKLLKRGSMDNIESIREWLQLFYKTKWNQGDWKVDLEIKTTMMFGV